MADRWREWICRSYAAEVGGHLAEPEELDTLAAVVLAHDDAADPLLVYVNHAAERVWERPAAEFVGMPSRLTAPSQARSERAAALAGDGVVTGYSGVRVSASGRLFRIVDATVWPVRADGTGAVVGQAATFREWEPIEEASP